jgi:hypothetical protein
MSGNVIHGYSYVFPKDIYYVLVTDLSTVLMDVTTEYFN